MNVWEMECLISNLKKNTVNNMAEIIQYLEQVHIALAWICTIDLKVIKTANRPKENLQV